VSAAPHTAVIAIAMATFEPDFDLFRAQVASLQAQTRQDWVCLISDDCSGPDAYERLAAVVAEDPRFVLSRSDRRQGFYLNFERALSLVPRTVSFVALADQDDRWHPEKLDVLSGSIGSARLVYSDARIVDRSGRLIADTFWSPQRPRRSDFAALLVTNTVTGAASLFRRELLGSALPFPRLPGDPYHDHWLALVALAEGEIAYVPRPLYDYVQHPGAVLGHTSAASLALSRGRLRRPAAALASWRQAYFGDYRRLMLLAAELQERCGPLADRRRARALERFLASERSPSGFAWLAWRWLRSGLRGKGERTLLAALTWRLLARVRGYSVAEPGSQR
jgi:glycosyltransferase involved in cell wall biosynthesis